MQKGDGSYEETSACMTALGNEFFSGWSYEARSVAMMSILTNFVAARVIAGASIAEEAALISQYLEKSVERYIEEAKSMVGTFHVQ